MTWQLEMLGSICLYRIWTYMLELLAYVIQKLYKFSKSKQWYIGKCKIADQIKPESLVHYARGAVTS